ncbi:MAG: ABC transporter permease [Alphaproteobacteria bacterium]|nr:ABC transporter permease [Alphaproteobacteria bacterium]
MARRSGSPFIGFGAVFVKELADHLGSSRMFVLEWLVLLTGIGAVYTAISDLKTTTASDPFVFLRLFTHARDPLPSFIAVLAFLVPLMAIGLGFDAINSEFNRRTMSRILAQPIYRDALLLGKFLAGLATLAIALVMLWLLVVGFGLITLGVPPSGAEVSRGIGFLVVALFYGGLWLTVAILCSVLFRSAATSALVALGLWLLATVLWPLIVQFAANAIYPPNAVTLLLGGGPSLGQVELQQTLSRVSPSTLFDESVLALLHPATRALGPVFMSQLEGSVMGAPLPFGQSLLLIWPQATGLVAGTIIVFVFAYIAFQRQEVRA